ncbi:hypothetical protein L228DRAFT_267322 [Xylona heveae TC161]|uniref:Uncharacterized protein n=1 Tax=Xylona heveae (strain CBS 132557 / TC161) TaxID=1328760 RepID=A0A165HCS9_XYLHT|nr:hypothetical protein L228DRAFT_267322 [Xylona heveae TC161]KZF23313.1 hypothetical protein L228DRAFT_267322 [Xylona heveae TC161]
MQRKAKGKKPAAKNPPGASSNNASLVVKWDISSLKTAFPKLPSIRPIPRNCAFPSPVGKQVIGGDGRLLSMVKQRFSSSEAVARLFDEIVALERGSGGSIRKEMLSGNGSDLDGPRLKSQSLVGFVAYLEDSGADATWKEKKVWREKVWEDYTLQIMLDEPLRMVRAAGQEPILARLFTFLDIRLFSGTSPDGARSVGFFIVNFSHAPIKANGVLILPGGISGPLPEFALIQCGSKAVFWWLTPKSMDYVPEISDEKAMEAATRGEEEFVDLADETGARENWGQQIFVV